MGFRVLLLLTLLFLLLQPFSSIANLHKFNTLLKSNLSEQVKVIHKLDDETPPTVFFEVTKPIEVPDTQPCTYQILQHKFGYTADMKHINGQPSFYAAYNPPLKENCPSQDFSKIVLEWTATCKGRQFGKVFGVWLSGVELFRSCTAEPIPNGIIWTVKKDITKYYSLLTKTEPQILNVFLDNIVDETYTGVYDVTITIHFYPVEDTTSNTAGYADLILPVSDFERLNKGLWFHINEHTQVQSKYTEIPQNVYKAVLEVYVSFHDNDEQWYANLPQDYIDANNINGIPGNGPFREVLVTIDRLIVGAVWPFTVIYTGGVNPLLWKPISGIGSFDLPSYDIDITHYLGTMLDGRMHKISFQVTNALNVWFVDANLHLWLEREKTEVKLLDHKVSDLEWTYTPRFVGLNGNSLITAKRTIFSSGSVEYSNGVTILSNLTQKFDYNNSITLEDDGNSRKVQQAIDDIREAYNADHYTDNIKEFKILLETKNVIQEDRDTYSSKSTLDLSIEDHRWLGDDRTSSLRNQQNAEGFMLIKDNSIVLSGWGNTKQTYFVEDGFDSCYSNTVISNHGMILPDEENVDCPN